MKSQHPDTTQQYHINVFSLHVYHRGLMTSVHMEEMKEACSLGKHRKMVQEQPEKSSGQFLIPANCTVQ
jgi:hypothetical protein